MAQLLIKDGVQPAMLRIVAALVNAATELGLPSITITAGLDGTHLPTSLHYALRAIDFRTHDLPNPQLLIDKVRSHLSADYQMFLEAAGTVNEHGHIEFQPKGN